MPFCRKTAAIPDGPAAGEREIIGEQMGETAMEASADIDGGDVVPALFHALPHPGDGLRGAG